MILTLRLGLLLALVIFGVQCRTSHVLTSYDADKAKRAIGEDLGRLRRAIGASSDSDIQKALLSPLLSLTHDREDNFDSVLTLGASGATPMPLFLYPRLTWPHLATAAGNSVDYLIPVVLNRAVFEEVKCAPSELSFRLIGWETGDVEFCFQGDHVRIPTDCDFETEDGEQLEYPKLHSDTRSVVLQIRKSAIKPNLYALQVLPKLCVGPLEEDDPYSPVSKALFAGAWGEAADLLGRIVKIGRMNRTDLHFFECFTSSLCKWSSIAFKDSLKEIRSSAKRIVCRGFFRGQELGDLLRSMRLLASDRFSSVPVLIDEQQCSDFSFVVAADLQLHKDLASADRFFALLEANPRDCPPFSSDPLIRKLGEKAAQRLLASTSRQEAIELVDGLSPALLGQLGSAKFVVLVGDCVDGAQGQNPLSWSLNAITGLPGVRSPYVEGGEMFRLRSLIRRCPKPVFAVPGNHDGGVGYPGITNVPLDILTCSLQTCWNDGARFVRGLNNGIPPLVRFSPFGVCPPRYDGLVEWQYVLGPTNLAFDYRGFQFVCLNSFNLDRVHRATIGGVAMNTGGGVQESDSVWLRLMLQSFQSSQERKKIGPGNGAQFVFMHHDPRAFQPIPGNPSYESYAGIYETLDTPVHVLTLGYGGLFSYGLRTSIFLPFVSPFLEFTYRATVGSRAGLGAREWSRKCYWDSSAYGASWLINVINDHLQSPSVRSRGDGIAGVFFAHNNIPLESHWLRETQSRHLLDDPYEPHEEDAWYMKVFRNIYHLFATMDDVEPPAWAQRVRVRPGKNARVYRVDDVSDTFHDKRHGFSLMKVGKRGVENFRIALPLTGN